MMQPDISTLEKNKKHLIIKILQFLKQEAESSGPDKKESLEVSMQCIESAFDVDLRRDSNECPMLDSLSVIFTKSFPSKREKPSVENIAAAEIYKSKGNDLMRNGLYREALDQYTRAIELNPENAVYYCNRAAAYSRLENHESVIEDCECAVRLDPTYGKAYGRLGIAYSNLNMFKKAHEAYFQALKMDPTNSMYQENFKLAEERLEADSIPKEPNLDLNQFMGNPTLMNMASQMLNDPGVRDVMSGILQMGNDGGNPSIDALLSMGQQLADQMQINNPSFVANLRRQFSGSRPPNNTDGNNSNCEDESMGNIPRPNDTNDPSV